MTKGVLAWLGLTMMAVAAAAQTTVTTSGGTTNTVPVFTGTSAIGSSPISVSGSNVGIGATSTNAALDVDTSANGSIVSLLVNASSDSYYAAEILNNGGTGLGLKIASGNGAGTELNITNYAGTIPIFNVQGNGDVGIGTGSPGSRLQIVGSADKPLLSAQTGLLRISASGVNGLDIGIMPNVPPYGAYFQATNDPLSAGQAYPILLNPLGGNVGIGTTAPGAKLEVDGGITLTASSGGAVTFQDGTVQSTAWTGVLCGGDYAEDMRAKGDKQSYSPGDVLELASGSADDIRKATEPYSTLVAGIYATKPGVIGRRDAVAKSETNIPMAMVGVVPTKVSTENGPIRKGDLLVSSSTPGYAMRGTDREKMLGAVLGARLSKVLGDGDGGASDWRKPELVVESAA